MHRGEVEPDEHGDADGRHDAEAHGHEAGLKGWLQKIAKNQGSSDIDNKVSNLLNSSQLFRFESCKIWVLLEFSRVSLIHVVVDESGKVTSHKFTWVDSNQLNSTVMP